MKITDRIHLIPDVIANPYILIDDDGLTLIDAGFPGHDGAILRFIEGLGYAPLDLKRILMTHSDLDHTGSLAAVKEATGARVYASEVEARAISAGTVSRQISRNAPFWRRWLNALVRHRVHAKPVAVDEILSVGQVLPILGGLHVIDSTGHTPGHLSFYAVNQRVLFCGDSMINSDDAVGPSRPTFTWDMDLAMQSARRQADLKPHIVCSGHGPPVVGAEGKMAL